MYRALASQNYRMGMRESEFFSLIGTQHFGKLFSPDGENVACNDYYFLVAFYSFNTGKNTTFTQVMFTLLFCLIPKEIRTTCLVDNLQLFFYTFISNAHWLMIGFAVQQYVSIKSQFFICLWVYIKHSLILHTSQYFWLAAFRNQRNKPINCLKRRQTFFFLQILEIR